MTTTFDPGPVDALRERIHKLERINAALMTHVERVTNQPEGAYSLFQTAIMLDGRVRNRTEELTRLADRLERSNDALVLAKNEAEQANRSKTRFLAAASHDLMQPLNATRLSVATLGELPLEPAAATILRRVERGLGTIEEVIKTLLDISKLDAGVVEPRVGLVAMREILDELEADYGRAAEGKGIRLAVRCPSDLVVRSDPSLLLRIAGNLVSNAVRYTASGGVLVAARRRGGLCRLEVVDTGRGIPAAEHDLVFEEFFRGGNAGGGENGLGLGLSIVRRLAATLDHRLSFSSRVRRGSWFRLEVPLSGPLGSPAKIGGTPQASSLAGASVLVVENDGPTLEAITQLLAQWGMVVAGAAGADALPAGPADLAAADLIIADYHLGPAVTGTDVTERLRTSAGRAIPALIVTADHTAEVQARVQAADCALLHKPIKPAQLRALISSLLN